MIDFLERLHQQWPGEFSWGSYCGLRSTYWNITIVRSMCVTLVILNILTSFGMTWLRFSRLMEAHCAVNCWLKFVVLMVTIAKQLRIWLHGTVFWLWMLNREKDPLCFHYLLPKTMFWNPNRLLEKTVLHLGFPRWGNDHFSANPI